MRDGFGLGGAAQDILLVAEVPFVDHLEPFVELINQRYPRRDVHVHDFRVGKIVQVLDQGPQGVAVRDDKHPFFSGHILFDCLVKVG